MIAGLPVLACDSGGPRETILTGDDDGRTGWLVEPDAEKWTEALVEIVNLSDSFPPQPSRPSLPIPSPSSQPSSSTPSSSNSSFEHIQAKEPETARTALALRAKTRVREVFGMEEMARRLEEVLVRVVGMGRVGDDVGVVGGLRESAAMWVVVLVGLGVMSLPLLL